MATYGYRNVPDRGFVAFESELDEGAWKAVDVKKTEEAGKKSAASLLTAPQPVIWKLRLRWGIAGVTSALGAVSVAELDSAWDAAQRRLFHRIAAGVDDKNRDVRRAADRLRAQLLSGIGTAQTTLDYNAEVDFGRQQLALAQPPGPLSADAKKLKLDDVLRDVAATTQALATGLGRGTGGKRHAPSRQLRDALADCTAAFNGVHDDLAWFLARTPPGTERDRLEALQAPLVELLARHAQPTPQTEPEPEPAPVEPPPGS